MRLLFSNHLSNAIESLRANRLRTFLTIVGVTIGVTSITAVLSLGNGATNFLRGQVAKVDESVALVRSNSSMSTPDSLLADTQALHATSTLTEKDATELAQIPGTKVAPIAMLHTGLKASDGEVDGKNVALIGSNSQLIEVTDLEMNDGQFLEEANGLNGMIMGHQLSIDLFGTEHPVGRIVNVRDQTYTVIGTLKPTNQPVNYMGIDFDRSAIIQLSSLKQFTQNVAQIQQIVINSDQTQPFDKIIGQADQVMKTNHHGEEDYVILTGEAITNPSSRLFSATTAIVAVITGISLLVGGIGIMNIMLVNVAERQREVGIRKAIGATNRHIINQFLIESAIIGLLGGIFGYLIGLSTAFLLSMYLPFAPTIEWQVAAISIGTAMLTGIIFGIYPAVRAARRDPIEALHQ